MSFKRRLIITIVLMIIIPILSLSLLAAVLLTSVYFGRDHSDRRPPDIVQVDREALREELRPGGDIFGIMVIWGASAVICTGSSFSAGMFYISRKLLLPLHDLRESVAEIAAGNLDVEVLSTGVEEVDELCSAIDDLRMRLKRSVSEQVATERERSLMLANLSHDLRTPVTAIKGYADGLREGVAASPEMRSRYIGTIYSKANDMERMIEQASDFSELELGRMRFDFQIYDGAAELENICRDFSTDFEAAGAEMTFENTAGRAMIKADPLKLRRVYTNLFSNALKYRSPDRPLKVAVSASVVGGSLRTAVRDNGSGIPAESVGRIFEGFYRADPARGGTTGHGLGLAISKQIIERHGGRIWVQSRADEGTDMYIALPLAEENKTEGDLS